MRDPLTPQESAFVFRSKPDISEEAPPTLFSDSKGGYRIVLPESIDPECFVQKLLTFRREQIQYLQPDFKLSLAAIENSEPAIDSQNTEDAVDERAVSPIKEIIQNGQQPQVVELTDEDIIVAVIDTGIDPQHPAYRTVCKDGWDFVHNQPLAYDPAVEMDQLHGTHISGLIAQQAPAAQLLPLKCFEQGNAYTSDIIDAIHYAETHGARIVNCSWVTD